MSCMKKPVSSVCCMTEFNAGYMLCTRNFGERMGHYRLNRKFCTILAERCLFHVGGVAGRVIKTQGTSSLRC
jgi:hypothetical protein